MSPAVSIFIIVLTVLNTVAAVWLLVWMRKRRGEAERTSDTTGHVWDGDLREYNNPLPRWWLWLFVLSVVFAVVYVALYPGLGNMRGVLGWSQVKEWQQMQAQQERQAQTILARFAERDPLELAAEPAAVAIGRNLFANNCAACHGSDGGGAVGFPSLRDADWLWGGSAEAIETSIRDGRTGIMAPWSDVIGDRGVDDAVAYVMSLSGRKAAAGDAAAGKAQYDTLCIACHGAAGTGNPALGAPNLTDRIWLHGGSADAIRRTIASGRNGVMPAHGERFGDTRVKLAAAYVISLGGARDAGAGSGT